MSEPEISKIYAPREVGDYYNRVMPEVIKKIPIEDTMQGCRPAKTSDLHDYVIKSADLKDGQRILDTGCGLGGPGMYFASKLNADIESWTNSEFCHGHYSAHFERRKNEIPGRVKVTLGDYHTVPDVYPEKYFDRILFLESFLHTSTPLDFLKRLKRILKDDGVLYMKEICLEEPRNPGDAEKIAYATEVGAEHFKYHYLTVKQLSDILAEAGWETQFCRKPQFENFLDYGNQYLYEMENVHFFKEGEEMIQWSDCYEFKNVKKK